MKKTSYHHQGQPKAVDASIPKPMLLGGNKLPGKLHIVGCVLLNAHAIAISVVRRHSSHPKMNRYVVALWEASTFPTLLNRLITLVNRAVGIVRVYNLSVLVEQRGIHLRMGGFPEASASMISTRGATAFAAGAGASAPLNVRIVSRGNANITIGGHGRSIFAIRGRILVNGFLRCIYRSVRRIAPVNCALLEVAESRFEPVMSAGSAKL